MAAQLAQSRAEAATSSEALAALQAQSDERQAAAAAQHAALAEELAQLRLLTSSEAPWEPGHRFSCPAKQARGKPAPNGRRAQN